MTKKVNAKPKGLSHTIYEQKQAQIKQDVRITCAVQECYDMLEQGRPHTPAELFAVAIMSTYQIKQLYNNVEVDIRCRDNTFAIVPRLKTE